MAVFIELETDPFTEVFSKEAHDLNTTARPKAIRRPVRGMQLKENTYSYIRLVDSGGNPIPMIDAGGEGTDAQGRGTTDYYTNFLVQSVQMQRVEKKQVVETFGSDYIYFFGDSPRLYTVNALVTNTMDFDWFNEFWYNYENYLRGSKLVEMGARAYIYNDDLLWEGYLLSLNANKTSQNRDFVPIQFTIFVINEAQVKRVGTPEFPNRKGADQSLLNNPESFERLLAGFEQNRNVYYDRARTSNFLKDLYTILTTGQLTYSDKYKRNPRVPLRGMIRDNKDEYIGAAPNTDVFYDQSDIRRMALLHTIRDFYELSAGMLNFMNNVGGILSGGPGFAAWGAMTGASFGVMAASGTLTLP